MNYGIKRLHSQGHMETNIYIGERLREEREALNLNQEAFAQLAKTTRQTQSNYEKGLRSPDAGYLYAVSLAGADVQYIITGKRAVCAAPLDANLLREVILGVEDGLKSKKVVLDSSNKSGLIVELYEHFLPTKKVDMSVINLTLSER